MVKMDDNMLSREEIYGHLWRGEDYYDEGNYDMAIEESTEYIRLRLFTEGSYYSDNEDICMYGSPRRLRGKAYLRKGKFDQAIADFTRIIELSSTLDDNLSPGEEVYKDRGIAYRGKGDYDMAIAEFDALLQHDYMIDIRKSEVYKERGITYWRKGNFDQAIADFETVLKLEPKDVYARRWFECAREIQNQVGGHLSGGFYYYNEKGYDLAIEEFTEYLRLASDATDKITIYGAYNIRGLAYSRKKDYDRAIEDFTQVIELSSKMGLSPVEGYKERGFMYYEKRDYNQAIADFDAVLQIEPNYTKIYEKRGLSYYCKKDYKRTIADYEAIIKLEPENSDAKRWLEEIREEFRKSNFTLVYSSGIGYYP